MLDILKSDQALGVGLSSLDTQQNWEAVPVDGALTAASLLVAIERYT